jgi:hypothetical protein
MDRGYFCIALCVSRAAEGTKRGFSHLSGGEKKKEKGREPEGACAATKRPRAKVTLQCVLFYCFFLPTQQFSLPWKSLSDHARGAAFLSPP